MRLKLRAGAALPTVLDLGGGLTLVGTQHPSVRGGVNEWRLRGPEIKYGYVAVDFYSDLPYPSLNTITVDPQGQGYGSRVIKALVDHYGGLTSDPQANTSNAAASMWKSLGGELIPTKRNSKGYYYQLVKK